MSDFYLLESAGLTFGEPLTALDFSDPFWREIEQASPAPYSTAILDNTTVRNALLLLDEDGLGEPASGRGTMLPDLAVLILAVTTFDQVVVLANGLEDEEVTRAHQLVGDALVYFDFRRRLSVDQRANSMLATTFQHVQERFGKRTDLLPGWQRAWADLLGENDPATIVPYYFWEEGDNQIMDSPRHPLRAETAIFDRSLNMSGVRGVARTGHARAGSQLESPALALRAGASYQTFRGIFYAALGEAIGFPYVACSMRAAFANFVPFETGVQDGSRAAAVLSGLRSSNEWIRANSIGCEYAMLGIHPSLARFLQLASQHRADWRTSIAQLRAESRSLRSQLALWNERLRYDQAHTRDDIRRAAGDLAAGALSIGPKTRSALTIGTTVGAQVSVEALKLALTTANIGQLAGFEETALKLLLAPLYERVLEPLAKTGRRGLRFILAAQDLVAASLGIDEELAELFGRGLAPAERAYLARLAAIGPSR